MQDYREGQRLQGSDGQIYVVVNGVPTLPAQPMQSLSSIVTPSPTRVAEAQRKDAREDRRDDRADRRESRAIDTENRKAQNDALANELKRLELKLKEQELSKGESGGRATALKSLVNQINRVQTLFNSGPGSTSGLSSALDYAPTGTNKAFDAAGASLSGQGLAAFRVPGTGTVSDRDAIMFDRANLPQASNFDAATLEQLRGLRSRVQGEYEALGLGTPAWEGLPDAEAGKAKQRADNELPDPTTGADLKPQPKMEAATGDTRTEYDDRASSMIDSLINAGASKATIDAVLKNKNQPAVTPGEWSKIQGWRKQNPDKPYFGAKVGREVPLNDFQKLAASPLGTGAARFANSATAGMVGALGGEKTRGALDAMAAANPDAAMAGDLSGGILGALGLEAGAVGALGGRGAAWLGPRLADAGFGGLSGFNAAQDGEGASGALKGAGAGLLGGMLGHTAGNVAGAAFRGIQNPAVRLLRERGVPLTVGQAAGDSGRIGAGIRNVENALTSVPGVNGVVNARYREGLDGFNQAAFRELPGHSGQTGGPGTVEAGELVNDAYSFLDGTTLPIDAPFAGSQAAVRADLPGLPAFGPQVGAGMDAIDASANRMGGVLPGREWQSAVRNTRADRSSIAGQPFARPAVGVMNDVEDNLMGLAQRQGPAGTTESLDAANMLNGSYQTLLRALDNGPAQQADELFTPSRLDAASRQGANAFGGRASSIAGDRPFYDLTTAGRAVLPSTVPDSGTATRGLVAGGVLSAGGLAGGGALGALGGDAQSGAGYGLGTALLLAAGGSRAGQRVLTSALLDRPDLAVTVGNALQRNANRLGWTGAGVLTPLAVGQ